MERRWLSVDTARSAALDVERFDFCLTHPNPILLAAEVRDGRLMKPKVTGRASPNPTMLYTTSVEGAQEIDNPDPPIRYMLIRYPIPSAAQEARVQWLTVGRTSMSDLMINDYTISKNHARIYQQAEGEYVLEDVGSTNGTWRNDERLKRGEQAGLEDADTVRFGRQVFTFFMPGSFYDFLIGLD